MVKVVAPPRIAFYPFLKEIEKEKETNHVHPVYPVGVKPFHHLTNHLFTLPYAPCALRSAYLAISNTKVPAKIILSSYCLFSGIHYDITPDNNMRRIRT